MDIDCVIDIEEVEEIATLHLLALGSSCESVSSINHESLVMNHE